MGYTDKILEKLNALKDSNMTEAERAVMSQVVKSLTELRHITQNEIAESERWIGVHPKHEEDIKAGKKMETSLRMVRQIIRDLRINYQVPILSDEKGYYLPTSEQQAIDYLNDLAATAKAQTKAWFETYKAMNQALNITQTFFEMQRNIFEEENK